MQRVLVFFSSFFLIHVCESGVWLGNTVYYFFLGEGGNKGVTLQDNYLVKKFKAYISLSPVIILSLFFINLILD